MSEAGADLWLLLPLGLAALLVALDMALVVALTAVNALSPVALRRLSAEASPKHAFVENLKRPESTHRLAARLMEQICLLGATALIAIAATLSLRRLRQAWRSGASSHRSGMDSCATMMSLMPLTTNPMSLMTSL